MTAPVSTRSKSEQEILEERIRVLEKLEESKDKQIAELQESLNQAEVRHKEDMYWVRLDHDRTSKELEATEDRMAELMHELRDIVRDDYDDDASQDSANVDVSALQSRVRKYARALEILDSQIAMVKGSCNNVIGTLKEELTDVLNEKSNMEMEVLFKLAIVEQEKKDLEAQHEAQLSLKDDEIEKLREKVEQGPDVEQSRRIDELVREVRKLRQIKVELEASQSKEHAKAESEIADLLEETKYLEKMVRDLSGENEELKKDAAYLLQEKRLLEDSLVELRAKSEVQLSKLNDENKKLRKHIEVVEERQLELVDAETHGTLVKELEQTCQQLRRQVAQLEEERWELEDQVTGGRQLQAQLKTLEQEKQSLEAKLANAREETEKQTSELKSRNKHLKKELKVLQDTQSNLQNRLVEEAAISKHELEMLIEQKKEAENHVEFLRAENRKGREILANFQEKVATLETKSEQLQKLELQFELLRSENRKGRETLSAYQQEIALLEERNRELEESKGNDDGEKSRLERLTFLHKRTDRSIKHLDGVISELKAGSPADDQDSDREHLLSTLETAALVQGEIKVSLALVEAKMHKQLNSVNEFESAGMNEIKRELKRIEKETLKGIKQVEASVETHISDLKGRMRRQTGEKKSKRRASTGHAPTPQEPASSSPGSGTGTKTKHKSLSGFLGEDAHEIRSKKGIIDDVQSLPETRIRKNQRLKARTELDRTLDPLAEHGGEKSDEVFSVRDEYRSFPDLSTATRDASHRRFSRRASTGATPEGFMDSGGDIVLQARAGRRNSTGGAPDTYHISSSEESGNLGGAGARSKNESIRGSDNIQSKGNSSHRRLVGRIGVGGNLRGGGADDMMSLPGTMSHSKNESTGPDVDDDIKSLPEGGSRRKKTTSRKKKERKISENVISE